MRRHLRASVAALTLALAVCVLWMPAGQAQGPVTAYPPPGIIITPASTGGTGDGAPTDAPYITQIPVSGITGEQALSALATGLLKSTTTTGVLSIATAGTDYVVPGAVRVGTTASSATPTPNADAVDLYTVTALAADATFGAPTGTPVNGQRLTIRITDNGTSRALAWNAAYRAGSDLALPTATTVNKTMYCGFVWNSTASKWDFVALTNGY